MFSVVGILLLAIAVSVLSYHICELKSQISIIDVRLSNLSISLYNLDFRNEFEHKMRLENIKDIIVAQKSQGLKIKMLEEYLKIEEHCTAQPTRIYRKINGKKN